MASGFGTLGKRENLSVKQTSSTSVIKLQVQVYLCKHSARAPGKTVQWKILYLGN